MVDINPINPQSVTVNVPSNGSLTVNNTGGSTAQVSTNADAQLAYSWACGVGLIQGIDYSAKYWAGKAKESELIAVNAIQGVEDAKDDAIAELESAKDTCLNDIELAGDDKVAEIEGLASDYESTLIALTYRAETAADAAEGYAQQAEQAKEDIETELDNYVPNTRKVNNKPLSTDITLTASDVGALSDSTAIPTKTSDLTNDSGYITGITSSDVTNALGYTPYNSTNPNGYQANVIETIKVNNTAQTVTNKAVNITVPTNTNQLTNGAGFITSSALSPYALSSSLATVATSGSYNDLSNKPTIPDAQVQADWDVTDTTSKAYIKNKPYIPPGVVIDQTYDGTSANAQSGVAINGELIKYPQKKSRIDLYAWTNEKYICYTLTETPSVNDYVYNANGQKALTTKTYDGWELTTIATIISETSIRVRRQKIEPGGGSVSLSVFNRNSTKDILNYYELIDDTDTELKLRSSYVADNTLSNVMELDDKCFVQQVINSKQDTLVSGTNIKTINNTSILGSGDIDTKEIFVATYGTTTYQEISDAITAGKTVMCKNSNGNIYTLTYSGNSINKYIFSYSGSDGTNGWIYYCEVDNANTWVDDYSVLADASLSGLSPQGQAKFDAKADTDLSNLSATGQGIIDAKVNNDDYYYKSGDTITNLTYWGGGVLTSSGKQIDFNVPLPKSLKNITTITCTALSTGFRKTAGGYMPSNLWDAKTNGTVVISRESDNMISVSVTYSNYGGTNNTPVGVYAAISLSFT